MGFGDMTIQGAFVRKRSAIAKRTMEFLYGQFFFLQAFIKEFAKLPYRQRMCEANKKTDDGGLEVICCRMLEGNEPVIVIEGIEEEANHGIKFSGLFVAIDNKNQDEEFDGSGQCYTIEPVEDGVSG